MSRPLSLRSGMRIPRILSGDTMEKVIKKEQISDWINKMSAYRIVTPKNKGGFWDLELQGEAGEVDLNYPNTVQSAKKMIFPQKETLFSFGFEDDETFVLKEPDPDGDTTVFLGVRSCDARAVVTMDRVFDDHVRDSTYWNKREKVLLVGLSCTPPPSADCFCLSVGGSPSSAEGFDVLMTDLGDNFFLEFLSEKGGALAEVAGDLLDNPKDGDRKKVEKVKSASNDAIAKSVPNVSGIPDKLRGLFDSDLWDEESLGCIRCGICTFLCPSCHCFDINDEVSSHAPLEGKRVRTWDNCQFPDFTMHSSGHNPRPDRASRLRQRINHKFNYFEKRKGMFQCTGCGRCTSKCPVGIDIVEILKKVDSHES